MLKFNCKDRPGHDLNSKKIISKLETNLTIKFWYLFCYFYKNESLQKELFKK